MNIGAKNKIIAAEICASISDIIEASRSDDEKLKTSAELKGLAISQHLIGGYLELVDMAERQTIAAERIATAFESIAVTMKRNLEM